MFEFSKLAVESQRFNSQRYQLSSASIDSSHDLQSYIGYKKQFGNENPLIQNANTIDDENRIPSGLHKLPPLFQSDNNIYGKYNKSLMNSEMRLNTEIPIKMVLEDIEEIGYHKRNKKINNENLFKSNKNSKQERMYIQTESFDEFDFDRKQISFIDKFNSRILNNKSWGNENTMGIVSSKDGLKQWKKPSKRNKIRELGYSIAMTKMPRDRKIYKILNDEE